MSANDKGPGHYKGGDIEHWDLVAQRGWDYFIGAATKYLWRLGKKHPSLDGQIEDLTKAIHYLEKKLELLKAERVEQPQPKRRGNKPPISVLRTEADDEDYEGDAGPGYVDQDR